MTRSVRHRLAGAALAAAALTALPVMLGPAPAQAAAQDIVSVPASQKDGYRQQILSAGKRTSTDDDRTGEGRR